MLAGFFENVNSLNFKALLLYGWICLNVACDPALDFCTQLSLKIHTLHSKHIHPYLIVTKNACNLFFSNLMIFRKFIKLLSEHGALSFLDQKVLDMFRDMEEKEKSLVLQEGGGSIKNFLVSSGRFKVDCGHVYVVESDQSMIEKLLG